MSQLRPEVRALVGTDLASTRPDRELASQQLQAAEEHLASGQVNLRANRLNAARSAFYEAIWYALMALLTAFGLRMTTTGGEGQHKVLMRFGTAELRDSAHELEVGRDLDGYRQQRNQQQYRRPSRASLGRMPSHAEIVVAAVHRRL